ncbi:MAG: TrbC/VirB2 family protein [Candidatus Micrarchaeia archaeon]
MSDARTRLKGRSKKSKSNSTLYWLVFAVSFIFIISFSFAQTTGSAQASDKLKKTLCDLYTDLNSVIPTVAFVLFVLAGVAYAGGQFFGAETRAKSISWSMSMVTGAVIGLLIVQVASVLISNLSGYKLNDICPGLK